MVCRFILQMMLTEYFGFFFQKSCFLLYILTRFSEVSDLSHEVVKGVWLASQSATPVGKLELKLVVES